MAPNYFCAKHAAKTATPIPDVTLMRRVRVTFQVEFAGVSWSAGAAQLEAVERARTALEAAGALPNLLEATSTLGQTAPKPGLGQITASGEQG